MGISIYAQALNYKIKLFAVSREIVCPILNSVSNRPSLEHFIILKI